MIVDLSVKDLMRFEDEMADAFRSAKIHAVVHLHSDESAAEHMIKLFENIRTQDWVLGTWRNHWQALLKGVPEAEVKEAILAGKSISLCFPKYNVFSSAIVGGIIPIAVGIAKSIAVRGTDEAVHVWFGDMSAETGAAHENIKYAENFDLPITFHVEDNNSSVSTDTRAIWGSKTLTYEKESHPKVEYSYYTMKKYPHAGLWERVKF
jgi:pyruvate dehydrogenase E1 component alpha subunit